MGDPYEEALNGYEDALIKQKPDNFQNVLTKAAKSVVDSAIKPGPFGLPGPLFAQTRGYEALSGMKDEAIEGTVGKSNTAMFGPTAGGALTFGAKMATDPLAWVGGGAAKSGANKLGSAYKNIKNPSKAFGESMKSISKSNPEARVNFSDIINRASEDRVAKKVIDKSGVLDKFGGRTLTKDATLSENLSSMNLEDSQTLINDIKASLRNSLKDGSAVKSTEIGLTKMLGELSSATKKAFPGIEKVRSSYGRAVNIGEGIKKAGKVATTGAITGLGLGAGGKAGYEIFKAFQN